jgi:PAS domain S-box-containing protein
MDTSVRILFVDATQEDDESATRLQAQREEFDVQHVRSAADGLDQFQDESFDCLVSSYELPDADGLELLREVREADGETPFILFPESGDEAIASRGFAAGATGYLRREDGQYGVLADRIDDLVDEDQRTPNEQQYHSLVEVSPVPMLVVDSDLEVIYANPSAGDVIADGDVETLLGRWALTLVPEEDRDGSRERLEAVLESREPAEVREYRYLTLDKEIRYARGSVVPMTFEGTEAAQILLEDLTDRKRREERLQRRRRQIERLHDVGVELAGCESSDAVYQLTVDAAEDILDLDMCLIGVVEDGRLTLGASSTEITEENYIEPPVDSEDAGLSGKAYRQNESYLIHDVQKEPDANPVQEYRSCIMTPINEFGTFQAVSYEVGAFSETEMELVEILVGHAHEALTRLEHERKLREQRDQLTRENERLDEFASIVSHDLRNPLNVVKGRLNHLQERLDNKHIEVALESSERMDDLITNLLTLAREGETVSEYETVELTELVERCWENVDTEDARLRIDTELVIRADPTRTQELLENLVRNSIEHGIADDQSDAGEPSLRITIGDLDEREGFYVEDDGPGIPPDMREEIFESGVTTSENGTGFGLAIVNRIAEAHGWDVTATGGTVGGARFEISDVEIESEWGESATNG